MSERIVNDPSQHGWVEVDGKWVWDASGGGGRWEQNGDDIYYDAGNVSMSGGVNDLPDSEGVNVGITAGYASMNMAGTDGAYIDFTAADGSNYNGRIIYRHSTDTMEFNTNSVNAPKLTIDSAGNAEFSGRVKSNGSASYVKYELHQDSAFTYLAQTPTEFSIQPNGEASKKFAIDLSSGDATFSGTVATSGNMQAFAYLGTGGWGVWMTNSNLYSTEGAGAISNKYSIGDSNYRWKDAFFSGNVYAADHIASSDERLKDNITTAPVGLIDSLKGREWDWKESGEKGSGVVAQELEQVLPHLVHEDDEGMKSVAYNGLIAYLVEELKDCRDRLAVLEAKE